MAPVKLGIISYFALLSNERIYVMMMMMMMMRGRIGFSSTHSQADKDLIYIIIGLENICQHDTKRIDRKRQKQHQGWNP